MTRKRLLVFAFAVAIFVSVSNTSFACDAPVFRYALERWPPDRFIVNVYHDQPFSADDRKVVDWLYEQSLRGNEHANFRVETVDVREEMSYQQELVWDEMSSAEDLSRMRLPIVTLLFPEEAGFTGVMWKGPLTEESAEHLVYSPAREQIADRIIRQGHAAVWVLVESGNTDEDERTAALVAGKLDEMADVINKRLKYEFSQITRPEERSTDFSMVRVSRDDPEEEVLISMLMRCEPGLEEFAGYPMLFPVYGRGRALYALAGKGINEHTLETAAIFLSGECACELKADNPGMDMLIVADWESYPDEPWIDDEVVLTSTASMSAHHEEEQRPGFWNNAENQAEGTTAVGDEEGLSALRIVLYGFGAAILVITIASILILVRRRKLNNA